MKKILNVFITLVAIVCLVYSCFSMFNTKNMNDRYFFNLKPILVSNSQSEPKLKEGSIVIVKKSRINSIKKGDIILFSDNQKLMTHEVVKNRKINVITKNIKENTIDKNYVTKNNLKGKIIFKMNFISKIYKFIKIVTR